MARIIKESSTLRRQACIADCIMGGAWALTLLSMLLWKVPHAALWVYIVPFGMMGFASTITNPCFIYIRGYIGERRAFKELRKLSDEYYLLNDVQLKVGEKGAQIDHVVVSPYGLWCVETKSHLGVIYGKEHDKNWTQVKRSEQGRKYTKTFYNPVAQNATHCRRLRDHLKSRIGMEMPIASIVVFTSADLRVNTDTRS